MGVYLDHAATARMLPEALEAYVRQARQEGNPSSVHTAGQRARSVVEAARAQVAASLGAQPAEVLFTAGGTESINQAVKGLYWAAAHTSGRRRVLIAAGEHHSTFESAEWLANAQGATLDEIPLLPDGAVDLDWLRSYLERHGREVAVLSLLAGNNEVGTLQPVERVVALASGYEVPVHVDAVSAYGQIPVGFDALGAAALSVSAHKIGGPMGVGALLLRKDVTVEPLLHGGGQERRVRSGTVNVPGAAAFGVAAEAALEALSSGKWERVRGLRDRLITGIREAVPQARIMGSVERRLPGNVHAVFPGCEGDSLVFLLDSAGFRVSTGSACSAGVPQPSHVLVAMGLSESDARSALRITLGLETTDADVDAFLAALPEAYRRAHAAGMSARAPVLGRVTGLPNES